jgi:hypothetical protein
MNFLLSPKLWGFYTRWGSLKEFLDLSILALSLKLWLSLILSLLLEVKSLVTPFGSTV